MQMDDPTLPTQRRSFTRRAFIGATGKAASTVAAASTFGPIILRAKTPVETVNVGCIGTGTRGGDLVRAVAAVDGVKVTAICDVFGPHRERGIQRSQNSDVRSYVDYRELLADRNVDAVVIGTPDHWHCQMVLDAVRAGKDIYCEKGLSRTLAEAKLMRDAIRRSGCVFQLGHQARQATCAIQAKEIVASGVLGPITLVRTGRLNINRPLGTPTWRWYGYYNQFDRPDPALVEKEVNWELWLGTAPKIAFNERHFWHWRCYWRYGTGQAGDLLSHELDFVQYILGHGIPDTCSCTGLNALLNEKIGDDREVPDTWIANYHFNKAARTVTFTGSMNVGINQPVELCGKEATLRFNDIAHDVTKFEVVADRMNRRTDLPRGYVPGRTPNQPNHMEDFIQCVRSRGRPKCNIDEAFIEVVTGLMSVESYRQQRVVRWDPIAETIL